MEFKTLIKDEKVLKALNEIGFHTPTKVQELSIPQVLDDHDLIVMAKTGSGKTGAFSLPIISKITDEKAPQALILAPTRELAVQINHDVKSYTKYSPVKTTTLYGGHNMSSEIKQLKEGVKIVVGTPGRVIHHIKERNFNTMSIRYLVLDEADRMLDMGFIDQIHKIIQSLPRKRVTLLFSATMPNEIQRICQKYMNEPVTVAIDSDTKTVDTIKQTYIRVEANEKRTQLERILFSEQPKSCMIFCNMRVDVDRVEKHLERQGFVSEAIHGANTQNKRMRTIKAFKNGELQVLVATDVAARGIHIDDMSLVINYDVPQDKDSYIHRIGRTGRAGNGGKAITLVTSDDVYALYEIEEHAGAMIEEKELPSDEDVALGKKATVSKWAEVYKKKAEVRKSHSRTQNHNKSRTKRKPNQRKTNRPKHNHHNQKSHVHRKEHEPMHKEPVRRVIEKNFVPIPQKKEEPIKKKKKFSIKNLFKK